MHKKDLHRPFWHRLFYLLMAFYVINASIDAPDGYVTRNAQGECREDLTVNDIESLGELVLEGVFDLSNAIPEHDEADDEEDQISKIFFDWSIPMPYVSLLFPASMGYVVEAISPVDVSCYCSRSGEISTPPPQAA
jgi:hypothetical protein